MHLATKSRKLISQMQNLLIASLFINQR
jgi:hypothetical protein